MPIDFQNKRVVYFESRRAEEMGGLIERHGGEAINAPTIREVKNQDTAPVLGFADQLLAGAASVQHSLCVHKCGSAHTMLAGAGAISFALTPEQLKGVPSPSISAQVRSAG